MDKSSKGNQSKSGAILLGGLALATTIGALAVVMWPQPSDPSREARQPKNTNGLRPSDGSDTPPASTLKDPQEELPFISPSEPFDTELEQKRLIEELEQAITDFPSDEKLLHLGALTYAEVLQTQRALALFEESLAIDSSNPDVFVGYADLLLQVGRAEDAVKRLESNREQAGRSTAFRLALAKGYSQTAQLDKAAAELEPLTPEPQYERQVRIELAQIQNQLKRYTAAEDNARVAIAQGTTDRAAYLALSTALMRQGKRDEAVEVRKEMPAIEQQAAPGDQAYQQSFRKFAAHTYAVLGSAFATKGLAGKAEQSLKYSLALDAASESALSTLVSLTRSQGRDKDALSWQQRLAAADPTNVMHQFNLASLAAAAGNMDVAEKALRKSVELDGSGQAHLQLSRFLMGLGKPNEAVVSARKGVAQLQSLDSHILLISALQMANDRVGAAQAFVEAKKLFPGAPQLGGFQP